MKNGGIGSEAAITAGYSPRSAKSIASETLKRPSVAAYLWRLMNKKGLTDDCLLDELKAGLSANKVISAVVIKGKGDASVHTSDADEGTNDFIEVEDWGNRHKYLETALKLKGHLGVEAVPTDQHAGATQINLIFPNATDRRVVIATSGGVSSSDGQSR